jgi:protein involved in polysaccharide export with SLBB domain
VVTSAFLSIATHAQRLTYPPAGPAFPASPVAIGGANLPFQPIGPSDLVHLTVYDSPERSQSFRVDQQGNLALPLLRTPLHAQGLGQ